MLMNLNRNISHNPQWLIPSRSNLLLSHSIATEVLTLRREKEKRLRIDGLQMILGRN